MFKNILAKIIKNISVNRLKSLKPKNKNIDNLLLKRRHNDQSGNYSLLLMNLWSYTLNDTENQ